MAQANPFNPPQVTDFVTRLQLNKVANITPNGTNDVEVNVRKAPWQIVEIDDADDSDIIVENFNARNRSVLLTISLVNDPTIDFAPVISGRDYVFLTETPDLAGKEYVQVLYSSPDSGDTVFIQFTGVSQDD